MSHIKDKIPATDYIGKTIDEMRASSKSGKLGLLGNLILAKVETDQLMRDRMDIDERSEVTEMFQVEAELTRNAFLEFLTSPDLHWTISELKASIEVEELKTTAPLAVKVDTAVNTTVNTAVSTIVAQGIPTAGTWTPIGITAGATVAPGAGTGKGVGTGVGYGKGLCTEPLKLRKTGAKHGALLRSRGYAYIGQNPQTTNFQAADTENDFTKVRLFYDKLKKEIIK